ncbi:MAG: HEPN domain-containing protein [Planctomycetota bacterium]
MHKRAQLWIQVSNREQSMANVLSRADLFEGAVLHAQRAAASALAAIFAHHGWARTSDLCADLCAMLEAHDVVPPTDVLDAARRLDARLAELDPEAGSEAPSRACTADRAAACLAATKSVRSFVNAFLSKY